MNNQRISKSNLLTSKEAASMLEVSATQLRQFVKKGLINKVKDKVDMSKTYYLKSHIENFLDSRYFVEGE